MIYEIAGLKVEMEPKFGRLIRQCASYVSFGEPVMKIEPDFYEEAYAGMDRFSEEEREYIGCTAMFCKKIIQYGGFFLHASAVVCDEEAYLFSASSGTGKSTHTALWREQFPGSYILNDDKPVIRPEKNRISVWGTPFSGKTDLQVNRRVQLKGICFLKQGSRNRICRTTDDRALALLLNNTWRPENSSQISLLLDMMEQVVKQVGIYEMSCNREPEAAELSYKVMKGSDFHE